jgi:hypothetical protein
MFSPTDPLRDLVETMIFEPLAFVASVPELLVKGKAKIESQTKTANMIGRFVVPMAKRKIDAELKSVAETVRSYLTNTEAKSGSGSRSSEGSDVGAPSAVRAGSSSGTGSSGERGTTAGASSARKPGSPTVAKPEAKAGPTKKATAPAVSTFAASVSSRSKPMMDPKVVPSKAVSPKPDVSKSAVSKAVSKGAKGAKALKTAKTSKDKVITSLNPTVNDLGLDSYDDLPASSVVGLLEALTPAQLQAIATYEAAHRNRQTILGGVARLLDTAP